MAGGPGDDDVVRRVHQRAKEQARPRPPEPPPDPIFEWFTAVYELLTDIRRKLGAFIETSEWLLEPVNLPGDPLAGMGWRNRKRERAKASAGWRLSTTTSTHFDPGLVDTREVTSTSRVYLLMDGRLFGSGVLSDDQFPAMLDNHDTTGMIVTLYASAGLYPPQIPPPPEAGWSRRYHMPDVWKALASGQRWPQSADQPRAAADTTAAYAFRDQEGSWHGSYLELPDGKFGVAGLSFHPPYAPRSPFYGQELEVRYGPWAEDGDISFHAAGGGLGRIRMTYEVIDLLFDQREKRR